MQCAFEIGPGSGVYRPMLASLFEEVVAADIASAFLAQARHLTHNRPNIRAIEDSIVCSRFASGSFDLIFIKPNSVLIRSTPQKYSLSQISSKIAFLPGVVELVRWVYGEPMIEIGHINLMTAKDVQAQLRQAGFKFRECHVGGPYLPLVAEFFGRVGLRCAFAGER